MKRYILSSSEDYNETKTIEPLEYTEEESELEFVIDETVHTNKLGILTSESYDRCENSVSEKDVEDFLHGFEVISLEKARSVISSVIDSVSLHCSLKPDSVYRLKGNIFVQYLYIQDYNTGKVFLDTLKYDPDYYNTLEFIELG